MPHARHYLASLVSGLMLCGGLLLVCWLLVWGGTAARADVFVLQSGGQVKGELVNPEETPRKTYQIKVSGGGQVTLEVRDVKEVKRQSPSEMKYEQVRGDYADTVDGQWKLAEWCRENNLSRQRKAHLERVVEIDPDHLAARRALGYSKVNGRWLTQEMQMIENGYVRYKNAWVLPQEVELREQDRKAKAARSEWSAKLKRWSGWLHTDKSEQAIENFRAIEDPFAAGPLATFLHDSASSEPRDVRLIYVEALGRLGTAPACESFVEASLYDVDEEIRAAALDQLATRRYQPAVGKFVKALKSKDNAVINRAATGLGQMKDKNAIGPLIDALVTTHTYVLQQGQPGQMSSTFGTGPSSSGGGTFNFGGSGTKEVSQQVENRDVLQALVELSGTSFNFDLGAWRYWYASQRKPQNLDARRDSAK